MTKRAVIVSGFVLLFAVAATGLFFMKGGDDKLEGNTGAERPISDSVHSYSAADLKAGCLSDDKIFCAIEQTVKCTMAPELDGCDKDRVPGFVLGNAGDAPRPTEISFKIVKIKPAGEDGTISVYTKSDCDAAWFGLCKGTVVYLLNFKDSVWAVTNIYALES